MGLSEASSHAAKIGHVANATLILRADHVPACSHVKELLDQKLTAVEQKITELRSLELSLKRALRKCKPELKTTAPGHENCCPVLEEITRAGDAKQSMKIEVLYFDGCPNHKPALERVWQVLAEEGLFAEVLEVNMSEPSVAQRVGFLGSPSIRVNGLDVEPEARGHDRTASCAAHTR